MERCLLLICTFVGVLVLAVEHDRPLVIGHRGDPQQVPEHTLYSYGLAIAQGADYIELDLVSTSDGVLICRHDVEIGSTTNIGSLPAFASYYTTKVIDGWEFVGWFADDLTYSDIQELSAVQRLSNRPQDYNDLFRVPSLDEALQFLLAENERLDTSVGVYIETKHPEYFANQSLSLVQPLLSSLRAHGFIDTAGLVVDGGIFIESFQLSSLLEIRMSGSNLPLIYLVWEDDLVSQPDIFSTDNLAKLAGIVDGLGAQGSLIFPPDHATPTTLVDDAHAAGLLVHVWTFASDRSDYAPFSSFSTQVEAFLRVGADGLFCDFPLACVDVRAVWEDDGTLLDGTTTSNVEDSSPFEERKRWSTFSIILVAIFFVLMAASLVAILHKSPNEEGLSQPHHHSQLVEEAEGQEQNEAVPFERSEEHV